MLFVDPVPNQYTKLKVQCKLRNGSVQSTIIMPVVWALLDPLSKLYTHNCHNNILIIIILSQRLINYLML